MTKKSKVIIGVSVAVAVVAAIVIGGYFIIRNMFFGDANIEYPFEGDGSTHTVQFDSQGGSEVDNQIVTDGNPLRTPQSPVYDGYTFIGWFTSADDNAKLWDFHKDRVHGDFTLYAQWKAVESIEYTESLTYERNSTGYTVTGAGQDSVIIIPATYDGQPVTAIGERAFAYSNHNADILSVTIPDSVTIIDRNAFHNRSELTTVNIGENSLLTAIGNNAFSGCGALESIYIPAGVTALGDSVFNNCGSLNNITVAAGNTAYSSEGNNLIEKATNTLIRGTNNSTIPASVTTIAPRAFSKTTATELVIPASVTKIGNYFIADSAYVTIRYKGTEEQWNAIEKSATMWNYGNRGVELVFGENV